MNRHEAEEHLRVIRSLMEKSTIYRAVAAPSALIGGLLALGTGIALTATHSYDRSSGPRFFIAWMSVLAVTGLANLWILYRSAQQRQEPFCSAGMKTALLALAPSHFAAGVLTAVIAWLSLSGDSMVHAILPPLWAMLYGLGLLATGHFAPRSLYWLGVAFVLTGVGAMSAMLIGEMPPPNLFMAATFGVLHIIYAICAWPRPGAATAA
jgi:hypothetical protein